MRMIKAAVAVLVVTSLFSNVARAQDYYSYYGSFLPLNPYNVMSIANNNAGAQWARSMKGIRVGDGQCTDLVQMAMTKSGARPGYFGNPTYYIWGARVTGGVWVGDVVQFENCKFEVITTSGKRTFTYPHHTAIVGDITGNWVQLIHQNAGGVGPVTVDVVNLSWKKEGTMIFWRPVKW